MNEMLSQRIKNASLFCAFLVVMLHIVYAPPVDGRFRYLWYANFMIGGMAVPYFFFIAGLLLAYRMDVSNWYVTAVRKRIFSLLVPYFSVCALWFLMGIVFLFISNFTHGRPLFKMDFLWHEWLCFFGLHPVDPPAIGVTWFLRNLFLLVLCSPVIKICIDRFGVAWLVFAFLFSFLSPKSLLWTFRFSSVFYFSAGIYCARHQITVASRGVHRASIVLSLCILCVGVYLLDGKFLFAGCFRECAFPFFIIALFGRGGGG